MSLLDVKNLNASYGQTRVLHGLNFSIEQGSITTLLGANGAGKTTTLRALCQMMVRTEGEIHFDGKRFDGKATEDIVRMGVAHVPDGRGTFVNLTTEEHEAVMAGAGLPAAKLVIPTSWQKQAIPVVPAPEGEVLEADHE